MPRTAHPRKTTPSPANPITQRLHTLLHTVRSIAQAEDELCTLLHEVERTGTLTSEASTELHTLLDKMPAHEYAEDLEAVRSFLSPVPVRRKPAQKKSARKPAAKSATRPKARRAKS